MSTIAAFETYPFNIVFLPESEGEGCVITFPDLPGCVADGATEEEAIAEARRAFHAWMTSIVEDGKPIPSPRSAAGADASNAFSLEQRERIRANIRARGMTFEVFLPEELADWLRSKIAAGSFKSPREAAFIAFQDLQALDQHPDARRALLTAVIEASIKDPRPSVPAEDVLEELRAQMRKDANTEPLPATNPAKNS